MFDRIHAINLMGANPVPPEQTLFSAAVADDMETAAKLLAKPPYGFDINYQDPATGFTALHAAGLNKSGKMFELLKKHGADGKIRDVLSFTALELLYGVERVKRQHYLPAYRQYAASEFRYYQFIVGQINRQLQATGKSEHVVWLRHVTDINTYLESHPQAAKIGFILEVPNWLKITSNDGHVVPMYFERNNGVETFVQFNSVTNSPIVLPAKENVHRRLFFSSFMRQASIRGCFEDAVATLKKLLTTSSLIDFCANHSNVITDKLLVPVSDSQKARRQVLVEKYNEKRLTSAERPEFWALSYQASFHFQQYFLTQQGLTAITGIHELTHLPAILLPHIEHYETMRFFRTTYPEQFTELQKGNQDLLDRILSQGGSRKKISNDTIRLNLANEDKEYDFSGRNFLQRKDDFYRYYLYYMQFIVKLYSDEIHKRSPLMENTQVHKIANTICQFVTGNDEKFELVARLGPK